VTGVRLEPLSGAHLTGLRELIDDPTIRRFTRIPDDPPAGFAEQWLGRYEQGRLTGECEAFALFGDDGAFLGFAGAVHVDREAATAELGYMIARAARGRGVATQALRELTARCFAQDLVRLELLIAVANVGSQKVAERCGYTCEGVLRSKHVKELLREDTQIWSRLPTDP